MTGLCRTFVGKQYTGNFCFPPFPTVASTPKNGLVVEFDYAFDETASVCWNVDVRSNDGGPDTAVNGTLTNTNSQMVT